MRRSDRATVEAFCLGGRPRCAFKCRSHGRAVPFYRKTDRQHVIPTARRRTEAAIGDAHLFSELLKFVQNIVK